MIVRLRFSKLGKIRFTSHRDVARMWERALRRADLPVAYTEGFHPRPKVSFGLALGTAHESIGEYLDITFRPDEAVAIEDLPSRLTPVLPDGLDVQRAVEVAAGSASLQQAVTSCTWRIEFSGAGDEGGGIDASVLDGLLAADELPMRRTRKAKVATVDVRPAILAAQLEPAATGSSVVLEAELATQPLALRPAELVELLDDAALEPAVPTRWLRTHQWISDGERREPIPLPSPSPHGAAVRTELTATAVP